MKPRILSLIPLLAMLLSLSCMRQLRGPGTDGSSVYPDFQKQIRGEYQSLDTIYSFRFENEWDFTLHKPTGAEDKCAHTYTGLVWDARELPPNTKDFDIGGGVVSSAQNINYFLVLDTREETIHPLTATDVLDPIPKACPRAHGAEAFGQRLLFPMAIYHRDFLLFIENKTLGGNQLFMRKNVQEVLLKPREVGAFLGSTFQTQIRKDENFLQLTHHFDSTSKVLSVEDPGCFTLSGKIEKGLLKSGLRQLLVALTDVNVATADNKPLSVACTQRLLEMDLYDDILHFDQKHASHTFQMRFGLSLEGAVRKFAPLPAQTVIQ